MKRFFSTLLIVIALLLVGVAASADGAEGDAASKKPYDMPFYIEVDTRHQLVTVYDALTNQPVREMLCSTGRNDRTPRGTFYLPTTSSNAWTRFSTCYIRYGTRITGSYWFHSILYDSRTSKSLIKKSWRDLGRAVSAGCIRLTPLDAQWINYHCKKGTRVTIKRFTYSADRKARAAALRREMNAAGVNSYEPTLSPTPTPIPPTLTSGMASCNVIMRIETRLQALGFFSAKPDKVFDEKTKVAIEEYQAAAGLPVTGEASPELQYQMNTDATIVGFNVKPKYNAKYPFMLAVNRRFADLGYMPSGYAPNTRYNSDTLRATKTLQRTLNVAVNGILTPDLMKMLMSESAPTPTAARYARIDRPGRTVAVRRSPSMGASKVCSLKHGARVMILWSPENSEWTQVMNGSRVGYVQNIYLTPME